MGFFERIFGYKNSKVNNDDKSSIPSQAALNNENAARLLECGKIIGDILGSEKYVPRSEYVKIKDYSADVDFFDVLKNSGMLKEFAKRNKLSISSIEKIMESYQDISRQRFDLTKELADITDAKIIAVGDDWQSIYAFSGSDISRTQ